LVSEISTRQGAAASRKERENLLSEELRVAHAKLADLETKLKAEELDPRKASTLYALVLGMAIKHYHYNPSKKQNSAAGLIVKSTLFGKLERGEAAVRQALRDAANKFRFEMEAKFGELAKSEDPQ
jgi:hypothetical protein